MRGRDPPPIEGNRLPRLHGAEIHRLPALHGRIRLQIPGRSDGDSGAGEDDGGG